MNSYVSCTTVFLVAVGTVFGASGNISDDFYKVIRANDTGRLTAMLRGGASVNTKDTHGETPLMYAAAVGSLDTMKLLIARGADVNNRNAFGATPLTWSVTDLAKVRLLANHGADVNAATKRGRTPLFLAAMSDRSAAIVRFLLGKGANAKATDEFGNTTLVAAALGNDTETIRALIDAGVDVNAANKLGLTPLMGAAGYNANLVATKMLLAKGANVNAVAVAPFQFADAPAPKAGPPLFASFTVLGLAAPLGPVELVKTLLDAHADVNVQEIRGMTPLMLALGTDRQDPQVIRLLLEHGADPLAKNKAGQSAADWAQKIGLPGGVELLKVAANPTTGALGGGSSGSVNEARTAVERSVALMERTSQDFFNGSGCISCHSQNMTDLAVAEARTKGLRVNEKAAKERLQMLRVEFPVEPMYEWLNIFEVAPEIGGYAAAGLAACGYAPDRMTDAIAAAIAAKQAANGSWHVVGYARPPAEEGDISRTAVGIRGLKVYGPPGRASEMQRRIAKAREWLLAAKPYTAEDRNMQLLGLYWAGSEASVLKRLADAILNHQQPDGGWRQREGLATDAYATGESLYALAIAGGLATSSQAYRKGVKFLLDTQAADGSWHVISRAPKIQQYFESGFPYGDDQWISSWATGWAAMALAQAIETPKMRAAK